MGCDDEEKNENKTRFKKTHYSVWANQLNQQATAQTDLKLRAVYNTNTKVLCL